ncbi:hypothetical protein [Stackebrandtia soli]|uniref:hypothetical protein n=1 Tax=Stackebrandtia soli TaxID=1892856 RepID=UPI0039EB2D2E
MTSGVVLELIRRVDGWIAASTIASEAGDDDEYVEAELEETRQEWVCPLGELIDDCSVLEDLTAAIGVYAAMRVALGLTPTTGPGTEAELVLRRRAWTTALAALVDKPISVALAAVIDAPAAPPIDERTMRALQLARIERDLGILKHPDL